MEVGKALKQLDQIRRERQALGQFYDEFLVRADRRAREDEAAVSPSLDAQTQLLIRQLAAAVRTERDHSRLLLSLLADAYDRLLAVLGIPPRYRRAARGGTGDDRLEVAVSSSLDQTGTDSGCWWG